MTDDDFRPERTQGRGLVVGLLTVLLICGIYFTYRVIGDPHDVVVKEKEAVFEAKREELRRNEEVAQREAAEEERKKVMNSVLPWTLLDARVTTTQNIMNELGTKKLEIDEKIQTLLSSPVGRAIAANDAQLSSFRSLRSNFDKSQGNLLELRAEFTALLSRFGKASMDATTTTDQTVNPQLKASVDQLHATANELLVGFKATANSLDSLLSQTPAAGVATIDLEAALEKADERAEADFLAAQAKAFEGLQQELNQKRLEESVTQERERLELERELQAKRHASEMSAMRLQMLNIDRQDRDGQVAAESSRAIAAADKALQDDMAKVTSVLRPFISKPQTQVDANNQFVTLEEPAPVSWATIQGAGVLDMKNVDFWRHYIFKLEETGRDRGAAPMTPFDKVNINPAQLLLKKHGEAMVRAGLLAP